MVRRSRHLAPRHVPRRVPRLGRCLAIGLLLASLGACSTTPSGEQLPVVVDTFNDVFGMFVGTAAAGPSLLHHVADADAYLDGLVQLRKATADASERPTWAPAAVADLVWALDCSTGITEADGLTDGLTDAWDGSYLSYGDDRIHVDGTGTLRTYDDGTLILACPTTTEAGLALTRRLIVPGSSPGGRLAVELIDVVGTSATPIDLAPFLYWIDDGADDYAAAQWHDHGATAAFAWGTKGAFDLTDPAVGVLSLISTGLEVDLDRTAFGDEYPVGGRAGASLATGQRAAIAMIVGIRGGFATGDGPGKDAAMLALGSDLAAHAGGAVCATAPGEFFVWFDLVENGPAIRTAICAGYAGL
jgi:hypothetical protein